MNRAVLTVLGAGVVALSVAANTTYAQRPAARQARAAEAVAPQAPRLAATHQAASQADLATPAAETALVKQVLLDLSQRPRQGRRSVPGLL